MSRNSTPEKSLKSTKTRPRRNNPELTDVAEKIVEDDYDSKNKYLIPFDANDNINTTEVDEKNKKKNLLILHKKQCLIFILIKKFLKVILT